MKKGFWKTLKLPCFVMAPMADVTDPAYRRIIARVGKPDVTWTEFVSADGLTLAPAEGKEKLLKDFIYTEEERPIIAQLFTANPEHMESAARLAVELGFDGIDINMGCPDRSIEKQGAGAAMIKDKENTVAVIEGATRGAESAGRRIPVSVKTRIGYNTDELHEWLPVLLSTDISAVTIHARTRKEMSDVPAKWEKVKEAVAIRDALGVDTLILGNGDVMSIAEARERVAETGCDGVMLGRAIFGNPWVFSEHEASTKEKLLMLVELCEQFEQFLPHKNFAICKKHFKAFANGFDGAKELRVELMESGNSAAAVREIVKKAIDSIN